MLDRPPHRRTRLAQLLRGARSRGRSDRSLRLEVLESRLLLASNLSIGAFDIPATYARTVVGSVASYAPVVDDATIGAAVVRADLNSGLTVLVDTENPAGTQAGDIVLAERIEKTAGGAARLELRAANQVLVASGAGAVSASGPLDVVLQADRDGDSLGRIEVASGAEISSLGGAIVLGGGLDPLANPARGSGDLAGTIIRGSLISAGGEISVRGQGTAGPGAASSPGILLQAGALLDSGSGSIALVGVSAAASGDFNLGVGIRQATVRSTSGEILIDGVSLGTGTAAVGVLIDDFALAPSAVTTATGSITVRGTGSPAASGVENYGVALAAGANRLESLGAGSILIEATAGAGASGFSAADGTDTIGGGAAAGEIAIVSDQIRLLDASVASRGVLRIAPRNPAASIGLGGGAGELRLDAGELNQLADGFSLIVIGDPVAGSGAVELRGAVFRDPVSIVGGRIAVAAGLSADGGITLTARDAPGSGQDVTIASGLVRDASGSVVVRAGDDFTLDAGASVSAEFPNAAFDVFVDQAPDADPGVGSTVTLRGTVRASAGTRITGGDDAAGDTFFLVPQAGSGIELHGGQPSTTPGDTLSYVGSGRLVFDGSGQFRVQAPGVQDVVFDGIELPRSEGGQLTAELELPDDGNPNELIVRLDDTGTLVQVLLDADGGGPAGPVLLTSLPLAGLESLPIQGSREADTLTIDSSNGLVSLPAGIHFDGAGGFDRLNLVQTGGATRDRESVYVGAKPGSGRSVLQDDGAIQFVDFEHLEPLATAVPVAIFEVTSTPGLASYLQRANTIRYGAGTLVGPTWGRVTVDEFEPIEFINKTNLVIDAGAGDDRVELDYRDPVVTAPSGLLLISVLGGSGDDRIDGSSGTIVTPLSLSGGSGSDTLIGGLGADLLNGGDGDDQLVDTPGNDTFAGGSGYDAIVVRGTGGADTIDVFQSAPDALRVAVNGAVGNNTLVTDAGARTVEEVRIEAGAGADILRVNWLDAHAVNAAADALRMNVLGGPDQAQDRLLVVDDGSDDLALLRKSQDDASGTIQIGPGNAEPLEVVYAGVERVQLVDEAGLALPASRWVVFQHDPFEPNDDSTQATFLGAGGIVSLDPTIDPGSVADPFGDGQDFGGDEDYYGIETAATGVLEFRVLFRQVPALASGRPGLPNDGNLNIEVLDAAGNSISGFGGNDSPAATDDERIRIPAVAGETYTLRVFGAGAAINAYSVSVTSGAPPVPYAMELADNPPDGTTNPPGTAGNSDTGRSQRDDVTYDATPTIFLRLDDAIFLRDVPGNSSDGTPPDERIPIPFRAGPAQPTEAGYAIAIFDEGSVPPQASSPPQTPLGFAVATAEEGVYTFTVPNATPLSAGSHFLTARVQMIDPADPQRSGFGPRSQPWEIVVDGTPPGVSFGGLDTLTNNPRPVVAGTAEANAVIRVFLETNGTAGLQSSGAAPDLLLGLTTAQPVDGTDQFPGGRWVLALGQDLDRLPGAIAGTGNLRTLYATAEDLAGNTTPDAAADVHTLFLDLRGPQIFDPDGVASGRHAIEVLGNPGFDLFDVKPSQGPTPAITSLTIHVRDLPNRAAGFLANALDEPLAENLGHYTLQGDHGGRVAIQSVTFTPVAATAGSSARGTLVLAFATPLPDDRYTLTIGDAVADTVGNRLDGESNAADPNGAPVFPSGDGVPGGDFVARFTVDSRPELVTACCGAIYADANGNGRFDPLATDSDRTNGDLVFRFGLSSDAIFAGDFAADGAASSSGFDKLGGYGFAGGSYRFLLDWNHDGVADLTVVSAFQVNALPVAGDFAPAHPGDEIGLFDGSTWYLDTNGDHVLDLQVATSQRGLPIVGDFNGDGSDDLAAFDPGLNRFFFDLDRNGSIDDTVDFGFAGMGERPLAGDLNLDGTDDLGLWVAGRSGPPAEGIGEWFFLVSDRTAGVPSARFHPFSPSPLGNDAFAQFGDDSAIPLLANLDPPIQPARTTGTSAAETSSPTQPVEDESTGETAVEVTGGTTDSPPPAGDPDAESAEETGSPLRTNPADPLDVNADGQLTPLDALIVANALNDPAAPTPLPASSLPAGSAFLDVNADGYVTSRDVLAIVNAVNVQLARQPEGEADAVAAAFATAGWESASGSPDDGASVVARRRAWAFWWTAAEREDRLEAVLKAIAGERAGIRPLQPGRLASLP